MENEKIIRIAGVEVVVCCDKFYDDIINGHIWGEYDYDGFGPVFCHGHRNHEIESCPHPDCLKEIIVK